MFKRGFGFTLLLVLLTACASETALPGTTYSTPLPQAPTQIPSPSPSLTAIPSSTPTATLTNTPVPTPTETPQPFYYQVKADDDMFGIALRFGIPLAALKTANPSIDPYSMSEKTTLLVPITVTPGATQTPSIIASPSALQKTSPSPTPVSAFPVYAYSDAAGGLWAFVAYKSGSGKAVENPTALLRLSAPDGSVVQEVTSQLPLNLLQPESDLPLVAYFPPPLPASYILTAQADFELPVPEQDTRYLKVRILSKTIEFSQDRLSARVEAQLSVEGEQAVSARAVLIAFDKEGQPVGYRQFDLEDPKEEGLAFKKAVYSLGPQIETVKIYLEAMSSWK